MTQIITILGNALQAVPMTIVPFLFVMALIGYLSYRIYAEFKSVYQKINTEVAISDRRITKVENNIAMTDEKTIMLSQKLQRIEESLERMNNTLIELSTTLKIMREDKTGK